MWTRETFRQLVDPPVVGMVHLLALPGAPLWGGNWTAVEQRAVADAEALVAGGVGAVLVENYHDVPFFPGCVPPQTVAAMTVLVHTIRQRNRDLPVGINVLRNDACSALAIAVACRAQFIRVNVHAGSAVTDQGLVSGKAHATLRQRRDLEAQVGILADVRVKHARPLAQRPLAEEAADLRLRGLADGVILTGTATGVAGDPQDVQIVRQQLPDCPLLVGSGLDETNLAAFAPLADGVIVGSSLKEPAGDGLVVSEAKTSRFVAAWRAAADGR